MWTRAAALSSAINTRYLPRSPPRRAVGRSDWKRFDAGGFQILADDPGLRARWLDQEHAATAAVDRAGRLQVERLMQRDRWECTRREGGRHILGVAPNGRGSVDWARRRWLGSGGAE